MRKIKILKVNATSSSPGSIEVSGDFSQVFQGKFYRNPTTLAVSPGYTLPAPTNSTLIKATTFEIVENSKYSGRYTVYSQKTSSDVTSNTFASAKTTIRVNEPISALVGDEASSLSSDGYITNISTYMIDVGTTSIIVPPAVSITGYPIDLLGRDSVGWGEVFSQNIANIARNFASASAPANPFLGMTWYKSDDATLRIWNGSSWGLANQSSFGSTYKHSQTTAAANWTVNHNLNLAAPFIGFVQFFVDRGNGPKLIMPSDVTFVSKDQLTVTFSNAEIGYVLVRQ